MTRMKKSSGNVFEDLGFQSLDAENLRLRSELMIVVQKLISSRELTQAQAAVLFGVTQPRVSDLTRGKLDLFSIDTLVNMLGRAGAKVTMYIRQKRKAA